MTLHINGNKIKDKKEHGVYFGSIPINAIYNGSTKIYQYYPLDPSTPIIYKSGDYTYEGDLPRGKYQVTIAGYGGNAAQQVSWFVYYSGSGGSGGAVYGTFNLSEKKHVILHSAASQNDTSYMKLNGKEAIKCTGGGTVSFDFFMNMSGNTGGVASVDNSLFAKTELVVKNGNAGSGKTTEGGVAGGASVSNRDNWGAGGATMTGAGTPGGIFLQFIGV